MNMFMPSGCFVESDYCHLESAKLQSPTGDPQKTEPLTFPPWRKDVGGTEVLVFTDKNEGNQEMLNMKDCLFKGRNV